MPTTPEKSPLGTRTTKVLLQHFSTLSDPAIIKRAIEHTPAGRITTPQDVPNVVAFLCSEDAFMIRGQVIVVDGGFTLPVPS